MYILNMKKLFITLVVVATTSSFTYVPAIAEPYSGYHEYKAPSITAQEYWGSGVKGDRFSSRAEGGSKNGGGNVFRYDASMGTYYYKDHVTTECYQNWTYNGLFYVKNGKTCKEVWDGSYKTIIGDPGLLNLNYKTKSFDLSISTDNPKTDKVQFYSGWYDPAPNKKTYIKSDLVVTKIGKNSARISNVTANKSKLFFTFVVTDMKGTKRYLYEIKSVWPDPTIASIKINGKDCLTSCSFDISRSELIETHHSASFNDKLKFPMEYDDRAFWTKNYDISILLNGNYLKNPSFNCESANGDRWPNWVGESKSNSINGYIDGSLGSIKFFYLAQTYYTESKTIKGIVVDKGDTYYTDIKYLKSGYWSKPNDRYEYLSKDGLEWISISNSAYNKATTLNCSVSGYKPTGKSTKQEFEIYKNIEITFNNFEDFQSDGGFCIVDGWWDETKPSYPTKMNGNDRPCTPEESALIPTK